MSSFYTGKVVDVYYFDADTNIRMHRLVPRGLVFANDGRGWVIEAINANTGEPIEFVLDSVQGWEESHDQTLGWR